MSEAVDQGTEIPDEIDIHTTAGKVADLDRRLEKQHAKG